VAVTLGRTLSVQILAFVSRMATLFTKLFMNLESAGKRFDTLLNVPVNMRDYCISSLPVELNCASIVGTYPEDDSTSAQFSAAFPIVSWLS